MVHNQEDTPSSYNSDTLKLVEKYRTQRRGIKIETDPSSVHLPTFFKYWFKGQFMPIQVRHFKLGCEPQSKYFFPTKFWTRRQFGGGCSFLFRAAHVGCPREDRGVSVDQSLLQGKQIDGWRSQKYEYYRVKVHKNFLMGDGRSNIFLFSFTTNPFILIT